MSDFPGGSPESVLPLNWRDSHIADHLDDPYSAAALAEPVKGYLEAAPIDVENCRVRTDLGIDYISPVFKGYRVKDPVQELDEIPDRLVGANDLFLAAAREILGDDAYSLAAVEFGYRASRVSDGGAQIASRPHIDRWKERGLDKQGRTLRLIGIACNALPTDVIQKPMTPEQLRDDGKGVKSIYLGKNAVRSAMPVDTLVLVAPALLHEPSRAEGQVDRIFLRWHLLY